MNQEEKSPWVLAYASVIGNGHIQSGIPCQDSTAHHQINEDWGVAVVCDGAGSAAQSHIGSDFVARNTAHCLEEVIQRCAWSPSQLPDEQTWRKEAQRALQLVMQRLMQFAEKREIPLPQLACTVLATLYCEGALLSVHIGDGRAAYSDAPGQWKALIAPYRGNEANETVFITSRIWNPAGIEEYIESSVTTGPIRAFALMSDGCEKAAFEVNIFDPKTKKYSDPNRPFPRFFEPNVPGLRQLYKEKKSQKEINTLWSGFLTAGTKQFKHEIDDKSMILAVRLAEVPQEKNI